MVIERLLTPETLVLIIPVAGIVVGGIAVVLSQVHRHRERMAMIEQGMDPDGPRGERGVTREGAGQRLSSSESGH
jgi:hypothetical protein